MPYDKPWYTKVSWQLVGPCLIALILLGAIFYASLSLAGGAVNITWNQPADCPDVDGWELLLAPITTAQPNPLPTSATVGASIQNTGTPACGPSMTKSVTLSGVGQSRFWIRAVKGTVKSGESNAVDASLPLAKPSGLSVSVP